MIIIVGIFLRAVGDSMSGAHIHDGDLLYVKKCNDTKWDDCSGIN